MSVLVCADALIQVSLGSHCSSLVDLMHTVALETAAAAAATVTANRMCFSEIVETVVAVEGEAVGAAVANTCREVLGVYVGSVHGALAASAGVLVVGLDALARAMRQRDFALSVAIPRAVEVLVGVLVVGAHCTAAAVVLIALVVPLQRQPVVPLGSRRV